MVPRWKKMEMMSEDVNLNYEKVLFIAQLFFNHSFTNKLIIKLRK